MHWEEKGIIGKAGVLKMAKNKKEEIASKWSEDWVPLKNIMNGMIQLENGEYVTGVKIAPKNIFILDAGTRDNVIYQLRNFLLTEFDKNDKASVATLLAALSVLEII